MCTLFILIQTLGRISDPTEDMKKRGIMTSLTFTLLGYYIYTGMSIRWLDFSNKKGGQILGVARTYDRLLFP